MHLAKRVLSYLFIFCSGLSLLLFFCISTVFSKRTIRWMLQAFSVDWNHSLLVYSNGPSQTNSIYNIVSLLLSFSARRLGALLRNMWKVSQTANNVLYMGDSFEGGFAVLPTCRHSAGAENCLRRWRKRAPSTPACKPALQGLCSATPPSCIDVCAASARVFYFHFGLNFFPAV